MKKLALACLAAVSLLAACRSAPTAAPAAPADAPSAVPAAAAADDDTSYAFGMAIGASIQGTGVSIGYDAFLAGLKAVLEGQEPRISQDEANAKIQAAIGAVQEKQAAAVIAVEADFLAANAKKDGVSVTASGLQYQVLAAGDGPRPGPADTVTVNYTGTFIDGTVFDSSVGRDEPATFALDQVIPGWGEGLQLMNVGSKYRLFIPSALAYGAQGVSGMIDPYTTMIFEVELLSIGAPAAAE
jgi:FKBP-type peptidyl-prolyl cis-trans isomerase